MTDSLAGSIATSGRYDLIAAVLFALVVSGLLVKVLSLWVAERKERDERRDQIDREAIAATVRITEALTRLTMLIEGIKR